MKKYLAIAVLSLSAFVMLQSCRKEMNQSEIIKEITIDTTLLAGSDYDLNLAPYGDDDNIATIIQQANHFSISQLEELSDVFNPVYHYASQEKVSGTDQVVLAISKNPNNSRCNKDSTIITINFTFR
jgi:hypothetical protein